MNIIIYDIKVNSHISLFVLWKVLNSFELLSVDDLASKLYQQDPKC